jgi:hypothetical protein
MTREDVVSKVRKLFELSNSSNENEAALAATKARELLSRYNLSLSDLPTDDIRKAMTATEAIVPMGKVLHTWVKGLLVHVSHGFECEHIIYRHRGSSLILGFIGTTADAEVAVYTFQFIYRELHRLLQKALPKLKRENVGWHTAALRYAYLDGAVKRIGERFREHTQTIRVTELKECKELVLAKEQMIKNYMARAFPNIRRECARGRLVSGGAFERGYRDAGSLSLRPGISDKASDKFAVTA